MSLEVANRSASCSWRPNAFDNRIPLTESVSSVTAVRSASVFCVFTATSRLALPTFAVSHPPLCGA